MVRRIALAVTGLVGLAAGVAIPAAADTPMTL
jgi:hypothetical protein